MFSANTTRESDIGLEDIIQTIPPTSYFYEQALEQTSENLSNTARCVGHTVNQSNKSPPRPRHKALAETLNPSSTKRLGAADRHSSDRRLSIPLTLTVKGIPQLKLLVPTPTSTTTSPVQKDRRHLKKERDRLHPTWMSKVRCFVPGTSLRNKEQSTRRRRTKEPSEDSRHDSSRCYMQVREENTACLLQINRKRKRENDNCSHLDYPEAKRRRLSGRWDTAVEERETIHLNQSENDPEKATQNSISKEETELAQISETPEPAPSTHSTSPDGPFDVDDINAAAAVLTVISDICEHEERLSSADMALLRATFEQTPYFLTCKGREESPELAIQFLIAVYDNPQSATWGGIESFDHLQLMLESLEKFETRAQAQPKEEQHGCFVV